MSIRIQEHPAIAATSNTSSQPIVGRFAPSPSGPLHFGSLVGAVASYCDARALGGQWLVRMEDLDPPREQPGAADLILRTLENHGLLWDQTVLYQSTRTEAYEQALADLQTKNLLYPCYCSRKTLARGGPVYPGTCVGLPSRNKPAAMRLRVPDEVITFDDIFLGPQRSHLSRDVGDFIVRRKDHLFAYQLAVVVDDRDQNISHVIRGSDLLTSTAQQIYLHRLLAHDTTTTRAPQFGHFPVVNDRQGYKLSKQHRSPAVNNQQPNRNLWLALNFLQQQPPRSLQHSSVDEVIAWALQYWDRNKIPPLTAIAVDDELIPVLA